MKVFNFFCAAILTLGFHNSLAQSVPKIAFASVTVAPSIAKQFQYEGVSDDPTSTIEGRWAGTSVTAKNNGPTNGGQRAVRWDVEIGRAENGSLTANIELSQGEHFRLKSGDVIYENSNLRLKLPDDTNGEPRYFEGELLPVSKNLTGQWHVGERAYQLVLNRFFGGIFRKTGSQSPEADSLRNCVASVQLRTIDRLRSVRSLSVIDTTELRDIPLVLNTDGSKSIDTNDPKNNELLLHSGINYLLLTSIEEYQEQTLDISQANSTYKLTGAGSQYTAHSRTNGVIQRGYSQTVTDLGPHVTKQQFIHFTVRCQVYDCTEKLLLESANHSFDTNRMYTVISQEHNVLAPTYLFDGLGTSAADWAVVKTVEAVFPIKVVDKSDREVTINRGADTGVSVGQSYDIFTSGKQIKDPATGEVLGNDEILVGRVKISEIHPRFSKANVWGEDKGIAAGALLRRVVSR